MKLKKLLGFDSEDLMSMKSWYEIIPDPLNKDPAHWYVKITKGRFKDLIYRYLTVSIVETAPDTPTLKFEYEVVKELLPQNLQNLEATPGELQDFHNFLGDILSEILDEHYKEVEAEKAGKQMKLVVEAEPTSLDNSSNE